MTAKPNDIDVRNVVAVNADGEIDRSALLGKLVFYSISNDIRVPPDELAGLFDRHGLERKYLPPKTNPANAFRNACRSFGKKPASIAGKAVILELSPALDSDKGILFILDRTTIDRSTVSRVPVKIGQIGWKASSPEQVVWAVEPECRDEYEYELLFEDVSALFDEHRRYLFGAKHVTPLLRRMLLDTWSVDAYPRGGLYIVPRDGLDLLDHIEEFVAELEADYKKTDSEGKRETTTEINSVPLVDGRKTRLLIKGKVESQVRGQLEDTIAALQLLLRKGDVISQNQLVAAAEARAAALELREHYAKIIGEEYSELDAVLNAYNETLRAAVRVQLHPPSKPKS